MRYRSEYNAVEFVSVSLSDSLTHGGTRLGLGSGERRLPH